MTTRRHLSPAAFVRLVAAARAGHTRPPQQVPLLVLRVDADGRARIVFDAAGMRSSSDIH